MEDSLPSTINAESKQVPNLPRNEDINKNMYNRFVDAQHYICMGPQSILQNKAKLMPLQHGNSDFKTSSSEWLESFYSLHNVTVEQPRNDTNAKVQQIAKTKLKECSVSSSCVYDCDSSAKYNSKGLCIY